MSGVIQRSYFLGCCFFSLFIISCSTIEATYDVTKSTIKTTYRGAKLAYKLGSTTARFAYKLGEFTFEVVMAPLDWPMTRDIETIDGLPPKEAVKQGRVKNAPYVVKGKRYTPMSVKSAQTYEETGIASWYGDETFRLPGGHMTANGEAFDPAKPSAAHKLLPLPTNVKVTNLDNGRSILLRVNDRGPFVKDRIIDLSAGAAKKLGFYRKGTARVRVETIPIS
jgi:rare lipoprotein A